MTLRLKNWIHSLVFMGLFTCIACSDESPAPKTEWPDPLVFGTYLTDSCGVGTSNYDRVAWEHDSGGGSTLRLNKAQGCGVYEGAIEFTPNPDRPHRATWEIKTRMCNRCETPRYLRWVRPRVYAQKDEGLEIPEGDLLSFGVDWDELDGPEAGDGLSGFIRYRDTSGGEYLTQCWIWPPVRNDSEFFSFLSPAVHQREIASGEWVRTQVGWYARMLFDEPVFGYYDADYQPVDFSRLETVDYLWPRMHQNAVNSAGEFPASECRKLGFRVPFSFSDEAVGGALEQNRGYEDWIPQSFEFQLNEPFYSQLFGLSSTWTQGQVSDRR